MAFGVSATCGPHKGSPPFSELSHIRIPYKVHKSVFFFYYLAHFGLGYGTVLVQWLKDMDQFWAGEHKLIWATL